MPRYNKTRHEYGTNKEKELKPFLEKIVGEEFRDAEKLYSIFDWETDSFLVELKSRTPQYSHDQFSEWLLPSCKADFQTTKQKIFFYYYEKSHKLYRLDYNPALFKTFKRGVPYGSAQEHLFCPASAWTEQKIDAPVRTV